MAKSRASLPSIIPGLGGVGGTLRDLFKGGKSSLSDKTEKPKPGDIRVGWQADVPVEERCKRLAQYYYIEGSFEKIQFARKWMRNVLIFQGYHELEWSEINVAWDVLMEDSGDYAFPNNYYRSLIKAGAALYLQAAPKLEIVPATDDPNAEAAASAARVALSIIKRETRYDYLRAIEALNLRLYGNSFRYSYYSRDPRYGYVTSPVYTDRDIVLSAGASMCPACGPMEGQFGTCPGCGAPIAATEPPIVAKFPVQSGETRYERGQIVTEVVSPFEIYVRSSSEDLWHAPFLIRNRVVDRLGLQAAYPDIKITPNQDEGGGEAYATGGDLSLIYLQSLADLPGDPTQYAAWYERATTAAKALLIEAWLRPSCYFFDKELIQKFPRGMYIAKTGDTLLEAREESLDDHWVHIPYTPVTGRIWGDGDDDVIPKQLLLDETDRLIQRNQAYNSSPFLVINSQLIDKNDIINDPSTIIECKPAGRPIQEAYGVIESQPLAGEVWNWRNAHLQDMQFHAQVQPPALGGHAPGVDTYGGQEALAGRNLQVLTPALMFFQMGDERWGLQVLKLAAENWLDEHVEAAMGLNGQWEYQKLRGDTLDVSRIRIISSALPVNPAEQSALTEAIAANALNPQDPRVLRKLLDVFQLPSDLDSFAGDAKVQWKEIEKMRASGQQIQPVMVRDNHQAHIETCRTYLNSDKADDEPQVAQLVQQHMMMHVQVMAQQQQMEAALFAPPPGAAQPGAGQQRKEPPQPHGGQVPRNPEKREQRAAKGAAAKPNRPQPSSGNQYNRKPAF